MSRHHFQKIRKLRASGLNKKQIAKELGVNWKTVSKYWESNCPPAMRERVHRTRKDPLEGFNERVEFLLNGIDSIKAIDVFEQINKEGYRGP